MRKLDFREVFRQHSNIMVKWGLNQDVLCMQDVRNLRTYLQISSSLPKFYHPTKDQFQFWLREESWMKNEPWVFAGLVSRSFLLLILYQLTSLWTSVWSLLLNILVSNSQSLWILTGLASLHGLQFTRMLFVSLPKQPLWTLFFASQI